MGRMCEYVCVFWGGDLWPAGEDTLQFTDTRETTGVSRGLKC